MFIQNENFGSNDKLQCHFRINGIVYPPHIHQFIELVYVISGKLHMTINGRETEVQEGCFAVIPPLHIHEFNTAKDCDVFLCAFSDSLIPEFKIDRIVNPVFQCERGVEDYFRNSMIYGGISKHPFIKRDDSVDSYADSYYIDLSSPQRLMRIKSCFYAVFSEYELQNISANEKKRGDPMLDLLLWLSEHYTEPLKLADAAARLGYSPNYLSHIIKRVSGMSFCDILGSLRIDCALKLLAKPHSRIIDIALDCGFSNERSFHRAFRRVTGKSPSEYLNGHI